jgi:hypothetical protein
MRLRLALPTVSAEAPLVDDELGADEEADEDPLMA